MTDDNATRDVATETGPGNDETGATTTREAALAADQYVRLLAAGEAAMRNRPALKDLRLRIDTVALAPHRFPRHLCGVDRSAPGDGRIR